MPNSNGMKKENGLKFAAQIGHAMREAATPNVVERGTEAGEGESSLDNHPAQGRPQ